MQVCNQGTIKVDMNLKYVYPVDKINTWIQLAAFNLLLLVYNFLFYCCPKHTFSFNNSFIISTIFWCSDLGLYSLTQHVVGAYGVGLNGLYRVIHVVRGWGRGG